MRQARLCPARVDWKGGSSEQGRLFLCVKTWNWKMLLMLLKLSFYEIPPCSVNHCFFLSLQHCRLIDNSSPSHALLPLWASL